MNAPVRFAYSNARLHALMADLWDAPRLRAALRLSPEAGVEATAASAYVPLIRWYATLIAYCPPARGVLTALLHSAEVENLKLLWRGAVRGRVLPAGCWRPLGTLATLDPSLATRSLPALVDRLRATPYAALSTETHRSHGEDLLAAELAFEGWSMSALYDAAMKLPAGELPARDLVFALLRERETDLIRRSVRSYGIEPSFAVGLTRVLRQECDREALLGLAAWNGPPGSFVGRLPFALRRIAGGAADWDALLLVLRQARARACRRALRAYPFQIAPAVAAVLLREEQARVELSLAAAGALAGGSATLVSLPAVAALGG